MFYFLALRTYMTRPRPARKAKWSPHLRTLRRAKRLKPRLSSSCFLPSVPPSITLDNLGLMDTPTFLLFFVSSFSPPGLQNHRELDVTPNTPVTVGGGFYLWPLVPSVLPSVLPRETPNPSCGPLLRPRGFSAVQPPLGQTSDPDPLH